ncbi:leucyl aminopeptidase [Candidatus Roizmanbacteria bacterium CG_4_10_14_0_8_um_filter_39_9]|uniref:Probable cytosol aminopeptidase n=1 Tax=Candidatus Roizmanbacteria bacterium CG_4_10_14_0_8_um_filter_39_9 TaxID=1974829 RepID=A0A2M7QDJ8_9BACT|nr:MAG: leucyl aminopeptidase [Candidatus Roizmanbacteria bacterium CG_4_10_14_0_8_um_filter_39_9]
MMNLEVKNFPGKGDALIYFIAKEKLKNDAKLKQLDALTKGALSQKIKLHLFEAGADEMVSIEMVSPYKHIVLYGLGKTSSVTQATLRNAVANAVRFSETLRASSATFFYQEEFKHIPLFDLGKSLGIGASMGNYHFDKFKGKETLKKAHRLSHICIYIEKAIPKELQEGLAFGELIAKGMQTASNLVNEPASHIHPIELAELATKIADSSKEKISVQILEKAECKKLGMGAFLGVAQGSIQDPKFILLKYSPTTHDKRLKAKKICLVGKSITFDSGGLSLKPPGSMEDMKTDMTGGATVLGIFQVLATNPFSPHEVWGVLPACENMVSGGSMRPGDIVTALNGKTIEVLNTDAEGRLALADAVSYAEKYIKPDIMIDIATLTGACMVALGKDISGIFGNDKSFIKQFLEIAKIEGEEMWELPLYKPYAKFLKSDIADLKNIANAGGGGAITAALFIAEFVNKTKWLHIDIAGPSFRDKPSNGVVVKGGNGVGVASIINLLKNSKPYNP